MVETFLTENLLYEEKLFHVPPLEEVKNVIQNALAQNFQNAYVEVAVCPDLKDPLYGLVESGLGGTPLILEIGGTFMKTSKVYNAKELLQKALPGKGKIFAIGAGTGFYNSLYEGIFNIGLDECGNCKNGSHSAKVHGPAEECVLQHIDDSDPRFALLANLFVSRGATGPVLKVKCSKRTGDLNLVECISKGLETNYKEKCVGMGGLFMLKKGVAYHHVLRDLDKITWPSKEKLSIQKKFYNIPAPLNAFGTLVSHDYDLNLSLCHFHSFSNSNWGGHFIYDTTPDEVEYEAYLNLAERVVRVDRALLKPEGGI